MAILNIDFKSKFNILLLGFDPFYDIIEYSNHITVFKFNVNSYHSVDETPL